MISKKVKFNSIQQFTDLEAFEESKDQDIQDGDQIEDEQPGIILESDFEVQKGDEVRNMIKIMLFQGETLVGSLLKLYEKIGEGGFGKVVRGFERYDNPEDGSSVWEQVAVKIFSKSSLNYKISFYNEKG